MPDSNAPQATSVSTGFHPFQPISTYFFKNLLLPMKTQSHRIMSESKSANGRMQRRQREVCANVATMNFYELQSIPMNSNELQFSANALWKRACANIICEALIVIYVVMHWRAMGFTRMWRGRPEGEEKIKKLFCNMGVRTHGAKAFEDEDEDEDENQDERTSSGGLAGQSSKFGLLPVPTWHTIKKRRV